MPTTAEDDLAYSEAECLEAHSDGSSCLPSWDGFGYICTYRVLNDKTREIVLTPSTRCRTRASCSERFVRTDVLTFFAGATTMLVGVIFGYVMGANKKSDKD
jgi:hypothetical protein